MRDTDLFQMALGLVPPWTVERSAFDAPAKRLDIYLDFGKGSRFVRNAVRPVARPMTPKRRRGDT